MKHTKPAHRQRRHHTPARGERSACVADFMTKEVVSVSAQFTLRETLELLADLHISGAPVISGAHLVGVITTTDLLAFQAGTPAIPTGQPEQAEDSEGNAAEELEEGTEAPAHFFTEMWADTAAELEERFAESRGPEWDLLAEHTVAEAMSRRLLTVSPETSLREAAAYILRAKVHRLLVLDKDELVGILTTTDIVRAVASGVLTVEWPGGMNVSSV